LSIIPPLHPLSLLEQSTSYYSDKSKTVNGVVNPLVFFAHAASRAPIAEKDQHDPQLP